MRAAIFGGPRNIVVGERPDPVIAEPSDATIRVTIASVCGSDLWSYRGLSARRTLSRSAAMRQSRPCARWRMVSASRTPPVLPTRDVRLAN